MRIIGLLLAIMFTVTTTLSARAAQSSPTRCYSGCGGVEYAYRLYLPWVTP